MLPMALPEGSKISEAEIRSATRHLFLCVGPDCCDPSAGEELWQLLKARTRKLPVPVLRTKAACFRVCAGGPWLVVQPDGVWYGAVTPERLERILDEHVIGGVPITEWVAVRAGG